MVDKYATLRLKNIDDVTLQEFIEKTNSKLIITPFKHGEKAYLTKEGVKFELFIKWFNKFTGIKKITMSEAFNYIDGKELYTETLDKIRIFYTKI